MDLFASEYNLFSEARRQEKQTWNQDKTTPANELKRITWGSFESNTLDVQFQKQPDCRLRILFSQDTYSFNLCSKSVSC